MEGRTGWVAAENLGQEASIRSETIVARARLLSNPTRSTTLFRRFLQALLFFLTVSFYHLNLQKNCFFLYGNSLVCEHGVRGSGGSCLAPPFMVMAGGASRGDGDGTPPSFFSLPTDADAATCAERREGDEVWTAARVDFGVWTHPPLGLLFSLLPVPAIINPSLAVRFPPTAAAPPHHHQ
jgi:hypothetical protein